MPQLTSADIVRRRLAGQFLTTPAPAPVPRDCAAMVRALGAVQAQDFPGAKWALGLRTGETDTEVQRAFDQGRIVRTHVMRPTWHLIEPADIRWMLALTAPRVSAAMASYNRQLELTPEVFRRTNAAIEGALRDGKHLTRAELRVVLERTRVGVVETQRLAHIMMQAELDAVVCSGPLRGKQFTYALLDERVPSTPKRDRDESLLDLALRYFTTRGPATVQDFSWWSGLSMADARRAITIAGDQLTRVVIADRDYWLRGSDGGAVKGRDSAHLLPNYDEYFIGHKDRSAIGQRLRSTAAVTGGNALIAHVVCVNGQLVGGWKRSVGAGKATVEMTLITRVNRTEKKLITGATERYGRFLRMPVRLSVRPG